MKKYKKAVGVTIFSVYLVISIYYLITLKNLNERLITDNYSCLQIVTNQVVQNYLIGGVILFIFGLVYIKFLIKHCCRITEDDLLTIICGLSGVCTLVIMISIFYEIQNPILRAFLSFYLIGHVVIGIHGD